MFATSSRLFLRTAVRRTLSTGAGCDTAAQASNAGAGLPPIQYHVFKNPLPYEVGLKLQTDIIDYRLEKKAQGGGKHDIILLLEHVPTYTTGRRDNTPNPTELHPEEKKVQNVGASFHITKRGGQVTYHGPGQLVGYPILDLNNMATPTRCYVDWLQALLLHYIRDDLGLENASPGIVAPHADGHVGVFAGREEKVASIGIHLRHRITSHGFATNVTREPIPWFDLVMACGLADVKAISMQDLMTREATASGVLPPSLPSVRGVAEALVPRFEQAFKRPLVKLASGEMDEEVEKLNELCQAAEQAARVENERNGGWPSRPHQSQ